MESIDLELLENGKFTSSYFKLVQNFNSKLDKRIDDLSTRIVEEFEKKKNELLKLKEELDDCNKIKNEITGLNHFYEATQSKSLINTIRNLNNDNPYKTNKNILNDLEKTNITIQNGDLMKKCFKTNSLEPIVPNEITKADTILSNFSRLMVKRGSNFKSLDSSKVMLEADKVNIILDFGDNSINPSDIIVRYFFLPNENKYSFSYITNVFGSNDNENWELLANVNLNDIKTFEKMPMFKCNLLAHKEKNETFYRYISLEASSFKEITSTNFMNRFFNKLHIPICGLEVYGEYTCGKSVLKNIDEQFEEFFDLYINKNYSELEDRSEPKFLTKMLLGTYKELTNLLLENKTSIRLYNILKRFDKEDIDEAILKAETEAEAPIEKSIHLLEIEKKEEVQLEIKEESEKPTIVLEEEQKEEKRDEQLDPFFTNQVKVNYDITKKNKKKSSAPSI